MQRPLLRRREAGFSFIEILVVMGIISVLVSMVVVVIPFIQEKAKQTKSKDNVHSMLLYYLGDDVGTSKPWPKFNGKHLVLWLVATGKIDKRNPKNLEVLFSPADANYGLDGVGAKAYDDVTLEALRTEGRDFKAYTSYAGRRNKEAGHLLTGSELSKGTIVICDDDDGPLHHPKGLVIGYSNGGVDFLKWSDLEMAEPDEKDPSGTLGDNSPNEELKHMSSGN